MAGAQVALDDRMCPSHPRIQANFICLDCDNILACLDCVPSTHQGHKLEKISNILAEKRQKIQDQIDTVHNEIIPELNAKVVKAKETKDNKRQMSDEQRRAIRLRGQKLKDEIDRQTEELIYECDNIEENNNERQESYVLDIRRTVDSCRRYIQHLSDTQKKSDIHELDKACEKSPSISFPHVPHLQTFTFSPGTSEVSENLKVLVGNILVRKDLIDSELEGGLKELSSFTHSSGITTLRCMDRDVWISYAENKVISCMTDSGMLQDKVRTSASVDSFCVFPTSKGKIWMCSVDDNSISMIANRKQIVQFKIQGQPLSISVENPDNILIGLRRCVTAYSANGQEKFSTDNPRKTNSDGYFEKVKDLFRSQSVEDQVPKKQQVVTWPRNICQDRLSGDIAIVDWDSTSYSGKGKPHIAVMDKNLSLKFRYYGTIDLKASTSAMVLSPDFKPFDVCYNNKSNLLVADYSSSSIQLINGRNGQFLQTLMWTDSSPKSLSLLSDCLWVGLENRNVKVLKYCT